MLTKTILLIASLTGILHTAQDEQKKIVSVKISTPLPQEINGKQITDCSIKIGYTNKNESPLYIKSPYFNRKNAYWITRFIKGESHATTTRTPHATCESRISHGMQEFVVKLVTPAPFSMRLTRSGRFVSFCLKKQEQKVAETFMYTINDYNGDKVVVFNLTFFKDLLLLPTVNLPIEIVETYEDGTQSTIKAELAYHTTQNGSHITFCEHAEEPPVPSKLA